MDAGFLIVVFVWHGWRNERRNHHFCCRYKRSGA